MKKRPLWNRVLVKLDQEEKVSQGGIIICDIEDKRQMGKETGVIVAMGPSAFIDMDVKVGNRVAFKRYAGINGKIETDDKNDFYRCMEDEDIAFVIEE